MRRFGLESPPDPRGVGDAPCDVEALRAGLAGIAAQEADLKRELAETLRPARTAREEMLAVLQPIVRAHAEQVETNQRRIAASVLKEKRRLIEGLDVADRAIRRRVQDARFRRALALASKGRQVRRPDRWARRTPQRVARPKRRRASRVHSARSPSRPPDDPVADGLLARPTTAIPLAVPEAGRP